MTILWILLTTGLLVANKNDYLNEKFDNFINKYNKTYRTDPNEYNKRLDIFQDSLDHINWLNGQRISPKSAVYGITQFSDLTQNEFQRLIGKQRKHSLKSRNKRWVSDNSLLINQLKDLPQIWDYREKNVISAVRNQGECGACWAHSIEETIEAMVALKTKSLNEYSVQQFIDCALEDNKGCDGGDTCAALVWLAEDRVKIQYVEEYPNGNGVGQCKNRHFEHGVSITGNFTCDDFVNKEVEMVRLLATHGPLVVAVDAISWQHYLGGVIQYHCSNDLNHAVQIVGYDLTGDIPYYIVRNTWGLDFGNDGYLNIAIGHDLCGIAEEVSAFDVIIS